MDKKFNEEIIDKNRINDKYLIDRIFKNAAKNQFDYLDSLAIIKNKNFLIIQLLCLLSLITLVCSILISIGYIICYLGILAVLAYCLVVYKKFSKIEKLVIQDVETKKIDEIKVSISKKCYELFNLMKDISIEEERIDYTKRKFTLKVEECKCFDDYQKILDEIKDDIIKYRNVSGKFKHKPKQEDETTLHNEITAAYSELELSPGAPFDEIKKKYRDLIKLYHPDESKDYEDKAIRLNNAYNLLKQFKHK